MFSAFAARLTYHVESGPSPRIAFPEAGPFDYRRGYSRLPDFERRLEARGFTRRAPSADVSRDGRLAAGAWSPPYREPAVTGLTDHRHGRPAPLRGGGEGSRQFERFEDVPPLLVKTLLFIENRELLSPADPRSNPVIEWDRLAKAALLFAGEKLGLPLRCRAAAPWRPSWRSTGTRRAAAPTRRSTSCGSSSAPASRRTADGPDTRPGRRQIVVDYLNTLPLAAAPGYGELNGLGDGLYAWFGLHLDDVVRGSRQPAARCPRRPLAPTSTPWRCWSLCERRRPISSRRARASSAVSTKYVRLLEKAGSSTRRFARQVRATPLTFLPRAPVSPPESFVERRRPTPFAPTSCAGSASPSFYQLDRLHLEVDSPFDVGLQDDVIALLQKMRDPDLRRRARVEVEVPAAHRRPEQGSLQLHAVRTHPRRQRSCAFRPTTSTGRSTSTTASRWSSAARPSCAPWRTTWRSSRSSTTSCPRSTRSPWQSAPRQARDPITSGRCTRVQQSTATRSRRPCCSGLSTAATPPAPTKPSSPAAACTPSATSTATTTDRVSHRARGRCGTRSTWSSSASCAIWCAITRRACPTTRAPSCPTSATPTASACCKLLMPADDASTLDVAPIGAYHGLVAGCAWSTSCWANAPSSPRHLAMLFYAWNHGGDEPRWASG